MEWFSAPEYWLARFLFQRVLAAVYLVAFLGAVAQFRPLLGERGLLPTPRFLERTRFVETPSLFHLRYSDLLLAVVAWGGVALSLAALVGIPDRLPLPASMAVWAVLWFAYLSIVNVGQTFYAFGWESLLTEAGFIAIFLGPAELAPPVLAIWLLRWLLFRVELGAGLIKLRGDPCWRDLTCLEHHHETQPLPNPLSWYFHHLPRPFHRMEVAGNHLAQLVAPFGLLLPQPVAGIAGAVIAASQAWLVLSGNFSWLNVLTIALAFSALADSQLDGVLPLDEPTLSTAPAWFEVSVVVVTALFAVLSYWPVRNMLSRRQRMNFSFNPWRLANAYGAFGSVSRERYEVILEGTVDDELGADTEWREYELKAKPGDPTRRPPQVAPYHLRLDWLMWFLPLSPAYGRGWFVALVERLLRADRAALRLLRRDPFARDGPPTHVRALLYHYRFSTPAERRQTGAWWIRRQVDELLPPVRLDADGAVVAVRDGIAAPRRGRGTLGS